MSKWESYYDFKAVNKSSQSYRGETHTPASSEDKGHVGGGAYNHGTEKRVECPGCGFVGNIVMWHGHNSFYECYDCETVIKVVG